MTELVFFLEELSAKVMLQGFLPKILPANVFACYVVFEGKSDLEKRLKHKLCNWQKPNTIFVILQDKDSGDCLIIKNRLKAICKEAGKPQTLIRIACHELESWYLGDLQAVQTGLNLSDLARKQNKNKFRTPDNLANASQELFKLTNNQYQKISGSRAIGPHLSITNNKSHSFGVFIKGIQRILELKTDKNE